MEFAYGALQSINTKKKKKINLLWADEAFIM